LASNILNDNLETLSPAFNIFQMHDKLCCFWRSGTRIVYDDTHQKLLRACVIFSQTAVVVLKNSFRN